MRHFRLEYILLYLHRISVFTQNLGQTHPSAAMRITKMILNQCSSLKRFPRAGAELSALTGYETELRLLICENYIALYRIDTSTVSVARIIHARQDYMRILLHEKTDEDTHQQK